MTTIDSPTTDAAMVLKAHVAELLASRQVKPGNKLLLKETVTEKDATKPFSLTPTGKIISQLAGVGYIEKYGEFKAKGISEIYIITMNDRFPTKVWKEKLAPDGTRKP